MDLKIKDRSIYDVIITLSEDEVRELVNEIQKTLFVDDDSDETTLHQFHELLTSKLNHIKLNKSDPLGNYIKRDKSR